MSTTKAAPFVGSIGLIRRWSGEKLNWLAIHDPTFKVDRFPQIERRQDETFRDALIRGLAARLPFDPRKDLVVSKLPRLHFQAPLEVRGGGQFAPHQLPRVEISEHCRSGTDSADHAEIAWHVIEFFVVDLYGQAARQQAKELPECRWWTSTEFVAGRHAEGTEFDSLQRAIICQHDIITPYSTG